MRRKRSDESYLWDMLSRARSMSQFISGKSEEDFAADAMLRAAVERCLEIIGEAANNISQDYCSKHPEIPWKRIIGQRHILVHDYGEVRHDRIWVVATANVPELIALLEKLLPSKPSDP